MPLLPLPTGWARRVVGNLNSGPPGASESCFCCSQVDLGPRRPPQVPQEAPHGPRATELLVARTALPPPGDVEPTYAFYSEVVLGPQRHPPSSQEVPSGAKRPCKGSERPPRASQETPRDSERLEIYFI
jgi:hypothetical protein